jgi:hypothetical protein
VQPKPRYRTTSWKQHNTALKARGSLTILLDNGMSWVAAASSKRGRSPQFLDTAIQFYLIILGLALRQVTGFVQSLLGSPTSARCAASNAVWMCRWRAALAQPACTYWSTLQASSSWVNASGSAKKHGPEHRRQWRKRHINIDA